MGTADALLEEETHWRRGEVDGLAGEVKEGLREGRREGRREGG